MVICLEISKIRLQNFVNGFDERNNNFDHFMVIVSAIINSMLEEWRIGKIGYDGPQVPRLPQARIRTTKLSFGQEKRSLNGHNLRN